MSFLNLSLNAVFLLDFFLHHVFYYDIFSILENLITRSCLKVNQTNMIQDCKANQLQEDSLCIKFDVFSNDNIIDETCRDQEKEIGNKLYRFCENTPLNGDCVYNLSRFLPADIIMKPPAKYISIVYSCKGKYNSS